jgi:hypothetical protein
VGWSFTADKESSAMLRNCSGPWDASNLTASGKWMRDHLPANASGN